MTEDIVNKKYFSITNVIVICSAVVQCVVMYFMLNSRVDATNAKITLLELRIERLEEQDKVYDLSLSTLAKIQGNMIKEEEPRTKNYK